MKRRYGMALVTALFAMVFCGALLLSGCSQSEKKNDEPDYADDRAMAVIAQGYQKRLDYIESLGEDADLSSNKVRKEIIKTEIDNDKELKKAPFKDAKMQEDVIAISTCLTISLMLPRSMRNLILSTTRNGKRPTTHDPHSLRNWLIDMT